MLAGKTALVTNLNHFVGTPAATALVSRGAKVMAHDAAFADSAARAAAVSSLPGIEVTEQQSPEGVVAAAVAQFGRLDAVISNDVYPAARLPIGDASMDDLRVALEALCVAPYALVKAAVAQFRRQGGGGRIVLITSAAPLRGFPNYSAYVIGRGAANAMVSSLARELGPENISINAFAPNYVESPTYFPPQLLANLEKLNKIVSQIPLGRLAKPEEAGNVVAWLASEESSFLTGHVLPFAGGWA